MGWFRIFGIVWDLLGSIRIFCNPLGSFGLFGSFKIICDRFGFFHRLGPFRWFGVDQKLLDRLGSSEILWDRLQSFRIFWIMWDLLVSFRIV